MTKRYVIESETNEFREMEEGEEAGGNLVIEEDEVAFLDGSCGSIEAIVAYQEGDETHIGVISEGELLVSGNIDANSIVRLLSLIGQRHNDNMLSKR